MVLALHLPELLCSSVCPQAILDSSGIKLQLVSQRQLCDCIRHLQVDERNVGRLPLGGLKVDDLKPRWQPKAELIMLQESLQSRPNSHELFGYDFVVDEALNVWLIEVNCSPSLEHSTPVTARLCAQMMDDLFKVCSASSPAPSPYPLPSPCHLPSLYPLPSS